jgi:CelD/BcsL family acetyltransferase involved in cellulose biosynthesis
MRQAPSTSSLRVVDPREYPDWDKFISRCRGGNLFHSRAWMDVLCDTYSYRPACIVREEGGTIVSALPVLEVKSWITGKRGISLPFTDECGVVASGEDVAHEAGALFQRALTLGAERGWAYTEIRSTNERFGDYPPSATFYTHTLNLRKTGEELFSGLDSSVRRAIRKAEREGLTVTTSTDRSDLAQFYRLHCLTRQRHGVPPQPFRFFEEISKHILSKGKGFICLAKSGSRVLAAAIFFCFREHGIYKFGASDYECQESRANNLVFWKSIEHLKSLRCVELDFGRTSLSNSGLRRFKRGWGSEEKILNYIRVDNQSGRALFSGDKSEGRLNALFRRLPIVLNRAVGRVVYSHIA